MIVRGGGWISGDNPGFVMQPLMRNESVWWNNLGWQTINIDYHPGIKSLNSVKTTYKRIKYWKTQMPKCLWGSSAGAHLSLMTAVENPDIKCVVSHGAPLDLPTLQPGSVKNAAAMVFCSIGTGLNDQSCINQLASVSPARNALNINAKVLIAANLTDATVMDQNQQLNSFRQARIGKQNWIAKLKSGTILYTHKNIVQASKDLIYSTSSGLQKKLADCVLNNPGATNCNANLVFTP